MTLKEQFVNCTNIIEIIHDKRSYFLKIVGNIAYCQTWSIGLENVSHNLEYSPNSDYDIVAIWSSEFKHDNLSLVIDKKLWSKESDLIKIGSYTVIFRENSIEVGCQRIKKETILKIAERMTR